MGYGWRSKLDHDCLGCYILSMATRQGDCLIYAGNKNHEGYGVIGLNYKTRKVTRVLMELMGHKLSRKDLVCHRCDNPACVNPNHLFIGSSIDNVRDMISKGRDVRGEKHHSAKISEKDVEKMISMSKDMSYKEIGDQFGISAVAAWKVVRGKTWRHIKRGSSSV